MPNITTKDVIKGYRTGKSEVIALRGLDMKVAEGELVAVQVRRGAARRPC
jgi:ABC-type lipoprotein export system ATPase subunit